MEDPIAFQDWELLQDTETPVAVATPPTVDDVTKELEGADSEDGIRADYFTLNSDRQYAKGGYSDREGSLYGSDNPSWADPGMEPTFSGTEKGELGMPGLELPPYKGFRGAWSSDESSADQKSPQKGEIDCAESSESEVGFGGSEGVQESSEESWSGSNKTTGEGVGDEDLFAEIKALDEIAAEIERSGELSSAESGHGSENLREMGNRSADSAEVPIPAGDMDKVGMVWWKLPIEILKYCVFKVRPVWSISIAAAFVGFVMLGRRLYKMKRKSRSLPVKVSIGNKASQFAVRGARLNEAISVVRHVPIIKTPLSPSGATPWPMLAIR